MTLRLILDRVEEGRVAVLTDDALRSYECPAELLPEGAKENDAFFGETDETGNIISLKKREFVTGQYIPEGLPRWLR